MATIEELDELSVELINGVEEEVPKESTSSPTRAHRPDSETADASAVVLSTSQALNEDSDDEDDVCS